MHLFGGSRAADAAARLLNEGLPDEGGPRVRLGDWLRTERLRLGITYAEVERDTRINPLYLQALEDEHFDVLPAPVYTRGFLRSYAKALGLDPEQAIAMLPAELPVPPGLEPMPAMRRSGDAPTIALPQLPTMPDSAGRWLLYAVGASLLVLVVVFVPSLFGSGSAGTSTPATVSTPATSGGTPSAAPPVANGKMPALNGTRIEAAQKTLQEIGAAAVVVEIPSDVPAGQVVSQSPSAGSTLRASDSVTLVVSRGR